MKKLTLAERIMAMIKGGDEAKLARFESRLNKYFDKQIAMRKEKIENLKDKVSDENEAMSDAILNVQVDKINTTDSVESYCSSYTKTIEAKLDLISGLEDSINDINEEISKLEKIRIAIYKTVEETK